jgi:hypothetical protein
VASARFGLDVDVRAAEVTFGSEHGTPLADDDREPVDDAGVRVDADPLRDRRAPVDRVCVHPEAIEPTGLGVAGRVAERVVAGADRAVLSRAHPDPFSKPRTARESRSSVT